MEHNTKPTESARKDWQSGNGEQGNGSCTGICIFENASVSAKADEAGVRDNMDGMVCEGGGEKGKRGGVLVAVATYNEIENLPLLVRRIAEMVPGTDILIVDDSSPDGTGRWAADLASRHPHFHLIERSGKNGLGAAVLEAFRYAIRNGYEYLVNLDADFSHPPEKIPEILAAAKGTDGAPPCDVAIGSRYAKGGKIDGWPLARRVMSRCINAYARLLLGLPTRDNSGAFRCYRVTILEKIDFGSIRSRGYSFFEEVLFRLRRAGATFREVPITFTDRVRGTSKINRKEAATALAIIFRIGLERIVPGSNGKKRQ